MQLEAVQEATKAGQALVYRETPEVQHMDQYWVLLLLLLLIGYIGINLIRGHVSPVETTTLPGLTNYSHPALMTLDAFSLL